MALHQPVALQLAQRGAEHAARDAVDLAQQLVEAMGAFGEPGEHDDATLGGEHTGIENKKPIKEFLTGESNDIRRSELRVTATYDSPFNWILNIATYCGDNA